MTWVGTLQIVDPHVAKWLTCTAHTEWPINFPDEQPKREHARELRRGELVFVVWESEKTCLTQVISRHGLVYMTFLDFYIPGWIDCEEVPWVVEQRDVEWYFRG